LLNARRVHQGCWILGNEAPLGGVTECAAQAAVNVTDGFGAQFSTADTAIAEELAVKLVQVDGTNFLDRHFAKVRLYLMHDQLRETFPSFRRDIVGSPVLFPASQEFGHRDLRRIDVIAATNGIHESDEFGLCLALGTPEGLVSGGSLAGAWIGAGFVFQLPTAFTAPANVSSHFLPPAPRSCSDGSKAGAPRNSSRTLGSRTYRDSSISTAV
jgi:hypothetical protein